MELLAVSACFRSPVGPSPVGLASDVEVTVAPSPPCSWLELERSFELEPSFELSPDLLDAAGRDDDERSFFAQPEPL